MNQSANNLKVFEKVYFPNQAFLSEQNCLNINNIASFVRNANDNTTTLVNDKLIVDQNLDVGNQVKADKVRSRSVLYEDDVDELGLIREQKKAFTNLDKNTIQSNATKINSIVPLIIDANNFSIKLSPFTSGERTNFLQNGRYQIRNTGDVLISQIFNNTADNNLYIQNLIASGSQVFTCRNASNITEQIMQFTTGGINMLKTLAINSPASSFIVGDGVVSNLRNTIVQGNLELNLNGTNFICGNGVTSTLRNTNVNGNLNVSQALGASSNAHLQIIDTVSSNGLRFLPNSALLTSNQFVGSDESVISTNQNNSSLVLTSANTTLPFGIRISSSSTTSGTITMRVGDNSMVINQTSNTINGSLNISGPTVNFLAGTNVTFAKGLNITNNETLITNGPISFVGGTTINPDYGTIYNATLNLTDLTTGTEVNVSNALTLPAGRYMITWIATFRVKNGSTSIGNYSAGYTTSTSSFSDFITRGTYNNSVINSNNFFSLSGCTSVSYSSSTNIFLRVSANFGTPNNLEFVNNISSLRAIKIA